MTLSSCFQWHHVCGNLYCGQAAWLLRVASCIDLTTLAGDDTLANVQRLCFKAKQPIRLDLMAAMGLTDLGKYNACTTVN